MNRKAYQTTVIAITATGLGLGLVAGIATGNLAGPFAGLLLVLPILLTFRVVVWFQDRRIAYDQRAYLDAQQVQYYARANAAAGFAIRNDR